MLLSAITNLDRLNRTLSNLNVDNDLDQEILFEVFRGGLRVVVCLLLCSVVCCLSYGVGCCSVVCGVCGGYDDARHIVIIRG